MIGEGANDVLRAFIALVGMRDVGLELKGVLDAPMNPLGNLGKLGSFAGRRIDVDVQFARRSRSAAPSCKTMPRGSGKLVGSFGSHVETLLRTYHEAILDRQYQLGAIADAAIELYVSAACSTGSTLWCAITTCRRGGTPRGLKLGRYYLHTAARRIRRNLADLWDNDDDDTTADRQHGRWGK